MLFLLFFINLVIRKGIKVAFEYKSLSKLLIRIWPYEGTTKNCRKYNKNTKITKKFIKS